MSILLYSKFTSPFLISDYNIFPTYYIRIATTLKLLIVDDNNKMRSIIRNVLEDCFDAVYEINDGDQAMEAFKTIYPDWVIMDIKMEHIDGITATENIKRQYPHARIIILTNFNDQELKTAAINAGADEYVLKDNLLELRSIIAAATL